MNCLVLLRADAKVVYASSVGFTTILSITGVINPEEKKAANGRKR
jgi:hypothetical protein